MNPVKKKQFVSDKPQRADRDRRVRQNERIARVLRLLYLIQSKGRWNAKALASELSCSERTIFRDLEVLQYGGCPWYYCENDQCYRVRSDFHFPVIGLSEEEAIGQAVATKISQTPGLDVGVGAAPTTARLGALSSVAVSQTLSDAMALIEIIDLKLSDHSQHSEALKTVQYALIHGSQITGVYDSPHEDKPVKLTLHPYRMCLVKQSWYLIGCIQGESQPKSFRIARFKSLRELEAKAERPHKFCLKDYFGNAWSVYRGDQCVEIELHFQKEVARRVVETNWHHTQKEKRNRDGSIVLYFTVDGLEEIQRWLLMWTGKVRIVKPAALRERVLADLRQGLKLHKD